MINIIDKIPRVFRVSKKGWVVAYHSTIFGFPVPNSVRFLDKNGRGSYSDPEDALEWCVHENKEDAEAMFSMFSVICYNKGKQ